MQVFESESRLLAVRKNRNEKTKNEEEERRIMDGLHEDQFVEGKAERRQSL
jgi:hypothetical protein